MNKMIKSIIKIVALMLLAWLPMSAFAVDSQLWADLDS